MTHIYAQSDNSKVYWSKNALQWSHFQGHVDKTLPYISSLSYRVGYEKQKIKIRDTVYHYIKTIGYIEPLKSWVRPEFKNSANLVYNQTLFDIVELSARKLQIGLNKGYSYIELPVEFQSQMQEHYKRIELFQEETSHGKDMGSVYRWANIVKTELENTPSVYEPQNSFKKGKWRYAMSLGGNASFFNGNTSAYFKNGGGVSFGMELGYKKSQFFFEPSFLTASYLKKDIIDDGLLYNKGFKISSIFVQIGYGYTVLDNRHWRIYPYAGLGTVEVSDNRKNRPDNFFLKQSIQPMVGINADYKARISLNTVNANSLWFNNKGEFTEICIKGRLGAMPIQYDAGTLKGWGLTGSVSLCISGAMVY